MSISSEIIQDGCLGDLTTLRQLQLLCGFSNQQAADFCGVSVETYRRWRTDRNPSIAAVRLLAIRAGAFPWPNWVGWEMHSGYLFPPGTDRGGFRPGEIMAISYLHALIAEQGRELQRLRQAPDTVPHQARAV